MKAILNNYRQSPRKMRLVANAVKGTNVTKALEILAVLPKAATIPLAKLIKSAIANAKENSKQLTEDLFIADLRVDGGQTLKRSMPRARGSAYQILKRTSKVTLVLGEQEKTRNVNIKDKN